MYVIINTTTTGWPIICYIRYHMQGKITQCWLAETEGIFS